MNLWSCSSFVSAALWGTSPNCVWTRGWLDSAPLLLSRKLQRAGSAVEELGELLPHQHVEGVLLRLTLKTVRWLRPNSALSFGSLVLRAGRLSHSAADYSLRPSRRKGHSSSVRREHKPLRTCRDPLEACPLRWSLAQLLRRFAETLFARRFLVGAQAFCRLPLGCALSESRRAPPGNPLHVYFL